MPKNLAGWLQLIGGALQTLAVGGGAAGANGSTASLAIPPEYAAALYGLGVILRTFSDSNALQKVPTPPAPPVAAVPPQKP